VIAIAVVIVARLVTTDAAVGWRAWVGAMAGAVPRRVGPIVGLGVAAGVAVSSSVVVNVIKFGMLYGIPVDRQYQSLIDPQRQEFLERSGGTLFLVGAVPTNVFQWIRPDAIGFQSAFPWVTFGPTASIIGDVPFDLVDRSTSVLAAMPLLVAMAIVGLIAVVRRREYATMRPLVIGAVLGGGVTLTIAYVAQRYHGDMLPLLIPLAIVGWQVGWSRFMHGDRAAAVFAIAVVVVLGGWSVVVNAATAIDYQRHGAPNVLPSDRAQYIGWQLSLPGGPDVIRVDELPERVAPDRTVAVVGACDAVYQSNGVAWQPVELSEAAGHTVVALTLPGDVEPGTIEPLVTGGEPGDGTVLAIEYGDDDEVRFRYAWDGDGGGVDDGRWVTLTRADAHTLDVTLDPATHVITVYDGRRLLYEAPYFHPRTPLVWGEGLNTSTPAMPLCRRL
jgi:hypothetical protein